MQGNVWAIENGLRCFRLVLRLYSHFASACNLSYMPYILKKDQLRYIIQWSKNVSIVAVLLSLQQLCLSFVHDNHSRRLWSWETVILFTETSDGTREQLLTMFQAWYQIRNIPHLFMRLDLLLGSTNYHFINPDSIKLHFSITALHASPFRSFSMPEVRYDLAAVPPTYPVLSCVKDIWLFAYFRKLCKPDIMVFVFGFC